MRLVEPEEDVDAQRFIIQMKQIVVISFSGLVSKTFPLVSNVVLLRTIKKIAGDWSALKYNEDTIPQSAMQPENSDSWLPVGSGQVPAEASDDQCKSKLKVALCFRIIGALAGVGVFVTVVLRTTVFGGHCNQGKYFQRHCRLYAYPLSDWSTKCPCLLYDPHCYQVLTRFISLVVTQPLALLSGT